MYNIFLKNKGLILVLAIILILMFGIFIYSSRLAAPSSISNSTQNLQSTINNFQDEVISQTNDSLVEEFDVINNADEPYYIEDYVIGETGQKERILFVPQRDLSEPIFFSILEASKQDDRIYNTDPEILGATILQQGNGDFLFLDYNLTKFIELESKNKLYWLFLKEYLDGSDEIITSEVDFKNSKKLDIGEIYYIENIEYTDDRLKIDYYENTGLETDQLKEKVIEDLQL